MTNFNTNDELKIEELDAIVGGGGVNWGQVGGAIHKVNVLAGCAMLGGLGGVALASVGAVDIATQ
jgi:hypothetical protein